MPKTFISIALALTMTSCSGIPNRYHPERYSLIHHENTVMDSNLTFEECQARLINLREITPHWDWRCEWEIQP